MSIRIPAQRPAQRLATGPDAATAAPVSSAEPGWGRVLRVSVARVALTLVGMLVVWSLLPILAGWTPRVILSGSMEPRVHVGDVVVTREVPGPTIAEGQVLTVADPDHPGRTRTHRVLSRDGETLVLKGDANQAADSSSFSVDDVQGVGVLRVPYVGLPAYWLAERNWLALGVTGLVLGWCVVGCSLGARRRDDEAADGPSTTTSPARAPRPPPAHAPAAWPPPSPWPPPPSGSRPVPRRQRSCTRRPPRSPHWRRPPPSAPTRVP